jgi:hypothetical protein
MRTQAQEARNQDHLLAQCCDFVRLSQFHHEQHSAAQVERNGYECSEQVGHAGLWLSKNGL